MKYFTSVHDVKEPWKLVSQALEIKQNPFAFPHLGKNKTLGLIFLNPSTRTRLSTQKAGLNLGMNVIVMNADKDGWALELEDGAVMNGTSVEHVKDAARVIGRYCDIVGIRCFPNLKDKKEDYSEKVLLAFMKHCKVPVVSMESATLHPLQSLADMMTITENWKLKRKPKIVLMWAPHIKPLPQAVENSFAEWSLKLSYPLTIAHPEGYDLCADFSSGAQITHSQTQALEDADFVYVKNWSSFSDYGKIIGDHSQWLLTNVKMKITNNAKLMHCLPVRRNVEVPDELLDNANSLIYRQAENRVFAAQAVLKNLLESPFVKKQEAVSHEAGASAFAKFS